MLKFSEIFEFSRENSYFERIRIVRMVRMVRMVQMVRMVRSLADRTFQLWVRPAGSTRSSATRPAWPSRPGRPASPVSFTCAGYLKFAIREWEGSFSGFLPTEPTLFSYVFSRVSQTHCFFWTFLHNTLIWFPANQILLHRIRRNSRKISWKFRRKIAIICLHQRILTY